MDVILTGVLQVGQSSAYDVCKDASSYNTKVGTFVNENNTAQWMAGWFKNSSSTLDDELIYKFSQKKGSYTLCLMVCTFTDEPILTVSIDGVSQGTIDLYSAAIAYNVIKTLAITILKDGTHTLSLKAHTKNGASSSYCFRISVWWLRD